jgi:hypothetical protein
MEVPMDPQMVRLVLHVVAEAVIFSCTMIELVEKLFK